MCFGAWINIWISPFFKGKVLLAMATEVFPKWEILFLTNDFASAVSKLFPVLSVYPWNGVKYFLDRIISLGELKNRRESWQTMIRLPAVKSWSKCIGSVCEMGRCQQKCLFNNAIMQKTCYKICFLVLYMEVRKNKSERQTIKRPVLISLESQISGKTASLLK